MRYIALLICISIALTGCSGRRTVHEGMMSALTCQQVSAQLDHPITCIPTDTGLLLQTIDEQATLTTETAVISFDSTVFWSYADIEMFLLVLDGVGSFSTDDETRLLRGGYALTIGSSPSLMTVGKPSEPFIPPRDVLVALPVHNLPRSIDRLEGQATDIPTLQPTVEPLSLNPTPTATADITIQSAPVSTTIPAEPQPTTGGIACQIPTDWDRLHLVQAGDTLTKISMQYDIDILDLIAGNCITNPDRLALNQEIRLPSSSQAPMIATTEPTAVEFKAERDVIISGDCVMLSWTASSSSSVSLGGAVMPSTGNQAVCPVQSQTYQLTVSASDGTQSTYSLTITVTE